MKHWKLYAELILAKLGCIERRLDEMSSQESDLQAAIADQGEKIDALVAAVNDLIASIPASVDLTDEIAAVQAATAEIQGVSETVTAADPNPGGA